jgi:hypothetical protein
MALITSEDLREWRPMRERAPRKYRRREPNPEAAPALLDLASAERVELASRLASVYESLHAAVAASPREDFFELIADRLAGALGLRRVAIRLVDEQGGKTVRVASYGPPLATFPNEMSLAETPFATDGARPQRATVIDMTEGGKGDGAVVNVSSLLVSPIWQGDRYAGVIVGDRNGERFELNQGELDLAQAMANIAALSLSGARRLEAVGVA